MKPLSVKTRTTQATGNTFNSRLSVMLISAVCHICCSNKALFCLCCFVVFTTVLLMPWWIYARLWALLFLLAVSLYKNLGAAFPGAVIKSDMMRLWHPCNLVLLCTFHRLNTIQGLPGPVRTWRGYFWWCWCGGRGSDSFHTGRRRCWWRMCWPFWVLCCRRWPCLLFQPVAKPLATCRLRCDAALLQPPRAWQWCALTGQKKKKDFLLRLKIND